MVYLRLRDKHRLIVHVYAQAAGVTPTIGMWTEAFFLALSYAIMEREFFNI